MKNPSHPKAGHQIGESAENLSSAVPQVWTHWVRVNSSQNLISSAWVMPVHHLPGANGGWAAAAECLGSSADG